MMNPTAQMAILSHVCDVCRQPVLLPFEPPATVSPKLEVCPQCGTEVDNPRELAYRRRAMRLLRVRRCRVLAARKAAEGAA